MATELGVEVASIRETLADIEQDALAFDREGEPAERAAELDALSRRLGEVLEELEAVLASVSNDTDGYLAVERAKTEVSVAVDAAVEHEYRPVLVHLARAGGQLDIVLSDESE